MRSVCVVGLGYIGLPMASLIAKQGFAVHGVDINTKVVESINHGVAHIQEPDLDILIKAAVGSGKLRASTEPVPADIFILAVPTPFREGRVPDVSYIESATRSIAPYIVPGNLIIIESTIPVGTTEQVAGWLRELRPDLSIPHLHNGATLTSQPGEQVYLAHCPERVLPGQILTELVENDRIIGGIDQASSTKARKFYGWFVSGNLFVTDCRSAELVKLSENAFRDLNIAFANELSLVCDQLGTNVWAVIELANRHPRVNILQPGPGVGGHCIAVDPWFLVHSAPERTQLIRTAREVNDGIPHYMIAKIRQKAAGLERPVIGCLGLAFKADVDDLRESPSVEIVSQLAKEDIGNILVVEPYISVLPESLAKSERVELVDLNRALSDADILVILVNHRLFSRIDWGLLEKKIIIDTRGVLHKYEIADARQEKENFKLRKFAQTGGSAPRMRVWNSLGSIWDQYSSIFRSAIKDGQQKRISAGAKRGLVKKIDVEVGE